MFFFLAYPYSFLKIFFGFFTFSYLYSFTWQVSHGWFINLLNVFAGSFVFTILLYLFSILFGGSFYCSVKKEKFCYFWLWYRLRLDLFDFVKGVTISKRKSPIIKTSIYFLVYKDNIRILLTPPLEKYLLKNIKSAEFKNLLKNKDKD